MDAFEKRSCDVKQRYGSKHQARESAAAARKKGHGNIRPYKCAYCRRFHVGHKSITPISISRIRDIINGDL